MRGLGEARRPEQVHTRACAHCEWHSSCLAELACSQRLEIKTLDFET